MSDETYDTPAEAPEEVVPDYSRVGFKALRALCKDRGIPADGSVVELIEKLKAYDAQHGKDVDLTAADGAEAEEFDLLADDEDDTATPESPVGGGEAASAPPPTGALPTITVPDTGTVTSAAPAVVVYTAKDEPQGLRRASGHGGRPDLTVKNGLVKVGEGHGAAEVRGFRREYPHGARELTDGDHYTYIADTHAAAHAAGHQTKGGATVGERVGYSTDADGRRTVVYQVAVKRQR